MENVFASIPSLIQNQGWKLFFSLLIPAGQFLWARYGTESSDFRKRQLRLKISDLGAQREALGKWGDVRHADQALADLNAEMEACMAQLVAVAHPSRKVDFAAGRSLLARWFLAYTPSGPLGWVLHSLFYANVLFILIGLLAIFSTPGDWGAGLVGVAVFVLPALLLRWGARKFGDPQRPAAAGTGPSPRLAVNAAGVD